MEINTNNNVYISQEQIYGQSVAGPKVNTEKRETEANSQSAEQTGEKGNIVNTTA